MRRILAFVLAVALPCSCGFVRSPKGEDTSGNALGALSGSLLDKGNPREQDYSPSPETLLKYEIPYLYDDSNSTLIEHMGYTLSYNSKLRIPNWVAYELLDSELYGDLDRNEKFTADPAIRGRQAYDEDYRGSGWDRGHMAPSGDMKWSSQAMDECFYLSNVCPQNHNLNAGSWNDLEKQVRYEARYYGRVWVVCGPVVGRGRYGTVGENKVQVPDGFFKALLAKAFWNFPSTAALIGEPGNPGPTRSLRAFPRSRPKRATPSASSPARSRDVVLASHRRCSPRTFTDGLR